MKNPPIRPRENPSIYFERFGILLLGLILFSLPLFFWIGTQDQFELPKLTLLRLLSSLLLGAWASSQALNANWRWRRSPLDLPLALWSLWLVVTTLHSVSPAVSWRGEYENFNGSLTQLNYSLLFWLSLQLLRSAEQAKGLLFCLELSSVAAGVYALFQALNLDFISWSSNSVVQARYFASMGNPNFLGALMLMALCLVLARLLERGSPVQKPLWIWLYLAALPFLCLSLFLLSSAPSAHSFDLFAVLRNGDHATVLFMEVYFFLLFVDAGLIVLGKLRRAWDLAMLMEILVLFKALGNTGTRGALAGLLASLGFFALHYFLGLWKRMGRDGRGLGRRLLFSLGGLLLLLLALTQFTYFLGPELHQRMQDTLSHPLQAFDSSRENIWAPGLKIAEDHWLMGTGVDTFKTVFPQYAYSRFALFDGDNVASRTAHCEPLQIFATMGIVGLLLWFWFLGAWAWAWWKRYQPLEGEAGLWLVGLAAMLLGYIVQNLVSFGVSGITVPFFVGAGMLWAGESTESWSWKLPWPKHISLVLIAALSLGGAWLATNTFRADQYYSFGHLVDTENQILADASYGDCEQAADYADSQLEPYRPGMRDEQSKEFDYWDNGLRKAEAEPNKSEAQEKEEQPFYSKAARALLLLLSTIKQESAVSICPSEVKYRIYLGLAYEDLYKMTGVPENKDVWFKLAENAYRQGSDMNPRNAYYHGNLARLYSLQAEAGQGSFVQAAVQEYQLAVSLAPSTKLFYENLILVYAQQGMPDQGLELLAPLESREPQMAGQLYLALGTTLYQWSRPFLPDKPKHQAILTDSLEALNKAASLDPENADIPYVTGAIYFDAGDKKMAKVYMLKTLAINPKHDLALKFMAANRL